MREPPEKTKTEKFDELVKAGAESLPLGGLLGYGFAKAVQRGYARRLDRWFEEVAASITWLEAQYGDLDGNEVLIDAVVNATRAAQATHQQGKLEALRNAIRNSVAPDAPEVEEQARFIRIVEELSTSHLQLLDYYRDPARTFKGRGVPIPDDDGESYPMLRFIELALPEYENYTQQLQLLVDDLLAAGLLRRPGTRVSGQPESYMFLQHGRSRSEIFNGSVVSDRGSRLLAYIEEPGIIDLPNQ
ncbi:hypothetical protein [Kribbella kalugense]|uniref:DUF4393 domain-containing protein n=1 Tax=Kribbella kalugense TaxID=2512221 RepID=A0A4R7ZVZ8_9ACTN|nr:hypothetical protein [Kribbella kalugense]TDW22122.1 hypothetical protein EV650_0955 [Kribbella kalugense]